MTEHDAAQLIRDAIPAGGGRWADLGAGTGTFTRALSLLLGPSGMVHAIEPDTAARSELTRLTREQHTAHSAPVKAAAGDFTKPLPLQQLAGILMANALHFVPKAQQAAVLGQLVTYLAPEGRIVLVEYDRDAGNQWVPHPVSLRALVALSNVVRLTPPVVVGRTKSAFGGEMYCAWTTRA